MIEWERIQRWDFIVDSVAYEYHKKFDMVETADIKQSLYQWFAEHPNKLNEWEAIGEKDAKNLLYRSLRNQALDYCQRWKAKSVGYDVSDIYYYNPEVVALLLPSVLRGEYTKSNKLNLGIPMHPSAPAEGGNVLTMMLEIDEAFWRLKKDERQVLFLKYAESMELAEIGKELELGSEDAVRMKLKRILKKLVRKMGGVRPFVDVDSESPEQSEPDLQVLEETLND